MDAIIQNGIALNPKSVLEKVDSTPTTDSENLISSGGVKQYVDQKDAATNERIDTVNTQLASSFFFKGSSTYASLPVSGNTINDTYYVTDNDKQCWYSWDGTSWIQSSMSQADYAGLIAQLKADMSSEFSTQKTYNVGDFCLYGADGKLYVCKTAITTTGAAWDSTKWDEVAFADAISDLILATDTQPTSTANKIWLDTDEVPDTVEVVTVEDLSNIVAPEFATASAYSTGDYVMHNAELYRAKQNSAANDGWVAARWQKITVMGEMTDELTNVKTQLDAVKAVTVIESEEPVPHILSLTWTDGYCRNDGVISDTSTTLHYSEKIPVNEGDIISYYVETQGDNTWTMRYITAYNGNNVESGKGAASTSEDRLREYTVPSGVDGIIITCYKAYAANETITQTTHDIAYSNILSPTISGITNRLDDISVESEYEEEHTSQITGISWTGGYVNKSGSVNTTSTTLSYSGKIPVEKGDTITISGSGAYFRFVAAYDGETAQSEKGIDSSADGMQNIYTVPDGIDGIIITVSNSLTANTIAKTYITEEKKTHLKATELGYMSVSDDLNDGEYLELPYQNVKNANSYVFNANVTVFDSIVFTKGGAVLTVDNTNITVDKTAIPHGLTIAHDITLRIENETSTYLSKLTLESAGNEFVYNNSPQLRFILDGNNTGANAKITSDGSTLTDCTFSWISRNINKPIWLFGDSYFSWYDDRWTYYLARDGFCENSVLNAYAGQTSETAYTALKNLLMITQPKIVVWCMGMNDMDSVSAVNATWKLYYEKLLNLKNKYNFDIVLYTVPTTPTRNNSYKNAIIRSSGYRYIEADLCVRIDNNGNWVSGALADNVHPTALGAKILYYRILADFPEIMCK